MDFRIKWSGKSIAYTEEEIQAVVEVMRNADPQTQGPYQEKFERDFDRFIGLGGHCYAMTNCASALEVAADLARIGPGDEVIIPAHTYCASAIPFGRTGAALKWADIDPETFLMSIDSMKELTTARTKVIVVVHLYGMLLDMDAINAWAKPRGIFVIEDCAQSLGAKLNGRRAGTMSDVSAFSFHAQKNLTTLGEGGVLCTKDPAMADQIYGLRHNGHHPFKNQKEYWIPAMSNVDVDIEGKWPHNFSMTEAQAALASKLLGRIDQLNADRRKRAHEFKKHFSEFPELVFQKERDDESHVHHLLPARYDGQKTGKVNHDLIRMLGNDYQIKTIVQYYPLYRYDLFKKMGFGHANVPHTDKFFDNMISFPLHHWMSNSDWSYLLESVKSALLKLRG